MIRIEVEGMEEMMDALRKLGSTGEKYLQKGLNEVGAEAMSEMRVNSPAITTRLRSSIHYESPNTNIYSYTDNQGKGYNGKFQKKASRLSVLVGSNVEYADAVNYGTAPHVITPKNAKALRFKVGGQFIFATKVNHPGTKGLGFFEKGVSKGEQILEQRLRINYDKAVREILG